MKVQVKKIGLWVLRRLGEKSTYTGIAMVAVALGVPAVAEYVDKAGQIALIVFGTGVAAATTSRHPSLEELAGWGASKL